MAASRTTPTRRVLGRLSLPERTFVADALRTETVGGCLLLLASVTALIWVNVPALHDSYASVSDFHFGPAALGLDLSVAHWAADGLLAVFFFVAGIELKRELVAGDLKDPRTAALPVVAALCGMAVPALVYALTNLTGGGSLAGWAVPTATDIAFALAVLAVIGTSLPNALRAFLLTLAVVDDLCAILIIAVFFTDDLDFAALGGAFAGLAVFWLLLRKGVRGWYVYVPLALVIWALMYNSGVHATIAGVTMGLMLRCTRRDEEQRSPGEHIEHLVRPLSAGVAVPLFALFSAGVAVSGDALGRVFTQPETLGVVLGLVVGKAVGIFGGTWLTARFTRASLSEDLSWPDVFAVSSLAGIGFTVSLLIGELAFEGDRVLTDSVKAAVLTGSLIAAVLATVLLKMRNAKYQALWAAEERDDDLDGIPDIYEQDDPAYHLRMAAIYERKAAEHRRLAEVAGGAGDGDDGPA
ncbi:MULTISPECIES: Na+/H+ antiporter NhaA [Streptomyces]|uniref:Na(+)/H(+) antiporter NhaA n=1 Tax=Streptomyces stelliscabiei TaxID=146820 RepID=A0A8I0TSV9_9ACTN|nr:MULTISPECIES: Na+/H+ antiporter NhaA [Streptomyces]KND29149.1 pH-dependent sodium/proton antiporter [Streptomyces stelliscabiei]MBE1599032.1 NhaA family Na+:H+ antiporter [Streptomyces stelliscabiei]MDX2520633.1 Na+/H+ antiporter NhaA [Streptomyces stelliscabiei]MDX2552730.1 Na+/H+ antiporter NhaA [Streptomyces stelliscabiei]MDX2613900.1 Na+/H+ antiporter NhaA [Streptomyces stelliscabiei]